MKIGTASLTLALLPLLVVSALFVLRSEETVSTPSVTQMESDYVESPRDEPIVHSEVEQQCAASEGWGDLKGRFTLSDAPKPAKITIGQDVAFCGKFGIVDEAIQTGDGGGLANVVIWLLPAKGEKPPEPHPSYDESAEAEVVLDNKNCRFVPRILLVRTTQKFKATNSDIISHNTAIGRFSSGTKRWVTFAKSTWAERTPNGPAGGAKWQSPPEKQPTWAKSNSSWQTTRGDCEALHAAD